MHHQPLCGNNTRTQTQLKMRLLINIAIISPTLHPLAVELPTALNSELQLRAIIIF